MEEPKYIDESLQLPKAMDFSFLRNEGIKKIQELTGAYWTDFNLHDPGVTILEQLCYGITDIAYRANVDIEQHLFSGNIDELPFYKPEQTLTNSPLTIEDYRKIFIDAISEIKNIWFEPVSQFESGFNGLYRVLIDVFGSHVGDDQVKEKILADVKNLFSKTRNLGEDIYELKILEEIPVNIHADIETDGIHNLESILAKVYFEVEQLLAPEIKFYSLNELISNGKEYDEIFNGPKLKHGFILNESLVPQQNTIVVSDIVRNIMQIDGIVSVKQLGLEVDNEFFSSQYIVPDGKIPRIITKDILTGNKMLSSEIKFHKGSLEYKGLSIKVFKRYLNEFVSENKKAFRVSESTFELPDEKLDQNYCEYYSVQNHFPAIYGVGKDGIPGRHDKKRNAQAKQLKSYLLIFEQFMANYLAQLAHFKDIFSLHKKVDQTYYTQTLDNVPNVKGLLADKEYNMSDSYLDLQNISGNYYNGLVQLNALFDDYADRRNRFLDYLLAIHGESFSQYTLQQFNYYYTEVEFEHHLIKCKNALLQNLGDINYSRQIGYDYLCKDQVELSGLEKRLAIFLGLEINESEDNRLVLPQRRTIFDIYEKLGVKITGEKGKNKILSSWKKEGAIDKKGIEAYIIEDKFEYLDEIGIEDESVDNDFSVEILSGLLPFRLKEIPSLFFAEGLDLHRYKLGKIPGKKKTLLVYDLDANGNWIVFGEFDDRIKTIQSFKTLQYHIVQANIKTENILMVEHILLRPSPDNEMYGVYINDEVGNPVLKSVKQYSLEERTRLINELEKHLTEEKYYSVEADENRDMNIVFHVSELDMKFSSINPQASVEDTHRQKELLFEFLSDAKGPVHYENKIGFYIQYAEDSMDIPEKFYSFQMSLIFPGWTARFQNHEFRSIAEDIVIEQKPANIYANTTWLEPDDMNKFLKLYSDWQKVLSSSLQEEDAEKKYEVMDELVNYLYQKSIMIN